MMAGRSGDGVELQVAGCALQVGVVAMKLEDLRNVLSAKPFQPFELHVADGRRLPIPHPEFLAVFPHGRSAIIFEEDGSFHVIDLLLVTGLHVGNGGSEQRRGRQDS
jgi:hypothetical protein